MLKKIFSLLFTIFIPLYLLADVIIPMTMKNGVYYIHCKINGYTQEFVFDTGASNVCISRSLADQLIQKGILMQSDKAGIGSSHVADGRDVAHEIYNIRSFTIGTRTLNNVKIVVIDGQNVPLLLGQSALNKLGKYYISGNKLIIPEVKSNTMTNINRDNIQKALDLYYQGNMREAANLLISEWYNGGLSNAQKLILMDAYNNSSYTTGFNNSTEALDVLHEIVIDDEIINTFGKDRFYLISGYSYKGALREINAKSAFQQAYYESSNPLYKAEALYQIGLLEEDMDNTRKQEKAYDIYWDAMKFFTQAFNQETGNNYSASGLMNRCVSSNSNIFELMDDESRNIGEQLTYSILFCGLCIDIMDYHTYEELLDNLISSGNRFARRIKRGY